MTACRAQAAPPLSREIRESPFVAVRNDGSALVFVGALYVTCQDCQRASSLVIVRPAASGLERGMRYRCVDCDG